MKPSELLLLKMQVQALKQQVCQTLDCFSARIEQHLPPNHNEARSQEMKNIDWSTWDEKQYGRLE